MPAYPALTDEQLQAVCGVLGDSGSGLTGTEIGHLLASCSIEDPRPTITKRYRLFEALQARQKSDRCSNAVLNFIQRALAPIRYRDQPALFDSRRYELNEVLAFIGWKMGDDGQLRLIEKATTLSQAQERAGRLRSELQRRGVHADVLKFCRAEFLQENFFHAVLEATKSIGEKIRQRSGLLGDGAALVDAALGKGASGVPVLAFNTLQTDSERSEHHGLMNLLKGTFSTFRNPTAHEPRILWSITERDALDLLTLVSLLHRRLDDAVKTTTGPAP